MNDIKIHLAFPDGALGYDCATCDQRCCKTGLLAVFPRERAALMRLHPAMELASPAAAGNIEFFTTPYSGCWFLAGTRCRLAAPPRTEARPCACALFPFNLFGSLGDAFVVAPNPLCPMTVARRPCDGIAHAEIVQMLGTVGAAGAPPAALRPHDPPGSILLERVVREASTAALDADSPVPLIAFVTLATDAFVARGKAGLATLDLGGLDDQIAACAAQLELFASVAGMPMPGPQSLAACAPLIAAWMPSLRLFGFDEVPLARLPAAFLALALYLAHWHDLLPERQPIPQTLAQLLSSQRPVISLLGALGTPWRGPAVPELELVPNAELAAGALSRQLPAALRERTAVLRHLGGLYEKSTGSASASASAFASASASGREP